MPNCLEPDEKAYCMYEPLHLELCCLQNPFIYNIACGSERVNLPIYTCVCLGTHLNCIKLFYKKKKNKKKLMLWVLI